MKFFLLTFASVVLFAMTLSAQTKHFTFEISDKYELKTITKLVSIDNVNGNKVWAYANDAEFAEFAKLNYKVEFLPLHETQPKVLNMATTVAQMAGWDRYPTYEVYIEMMQKFATDYPDLCKVVNIGTSVQGRQLVALKISDNVNMHEAEPEFFYTGTMHGDETTGFVLLLRLADFLLSNYGTDADATYILENIELYINPAANPDGTYNGGNSSVSGSQRYNSNGVDLNRNFPDELSINGPYQIETQAMMDFAEAHHFSMSANFHGGAEVMNYPWDIWYSTERPHADTDWFEKICSNYVSSARELYPNYMSDVTSDGVTEGADWYIAEGTRQDFMMYYQHCREVTVELSSSKLLSTDQLNNFWSYNKQALIDFLKEVTYGINGTVTNVDGEPLDAKIEIAAHDKDKSEVYTDPEKGDYYRPIEPGAYDVTYSSEGYISQTHTITVSDWKITQLTNVILEKALLYNISGNITDINAQPLNGVKIEIANSSIPAVYTDISGNYVLPDVYEGEHRLNVSLAGFQFERRDISVLGGDVVADFILNPSTAESFENQVSQSFTFGGNQPWTRVFGTAFDGDYALKSGAIDHNQNSIMEYQMNVSELSPLSFYFKVSSEATYDFLKFYVDDVLQNSWSGTVDWTKMSYDIAPGLHKFTWKYIKDQAAVSGSDCAWVDYMEFPKSVSDTEYVSTRDFTIFPNPTSGYFQILSNENYELSGEIVDLTGRVVKTFKNTSQFIKLTDSGIFIVKLNTPDGIVSRRIVVLK